MPAQHDTTVSAVAQLRAAADRLVAQVGHWPPERWARRARSGTSRTRADHVHALVQRLADLGAAAEGRAGRPVPRLRNDLALVDQVRVMVGDLVTTAELAGSAGTSGVIADSLDAAAEAIEATRRRL